jgi:molecular chaperone HscB
MNYFEFFEIPIAFMLDEKALRTQFLKQSKQLHPDFYTLESEEKQAQVLELSTLNNEAYKILSNFDSRMHYILEFKGCVGEGQSNPLPQAFLMEMMDVNEQLMELQFDYDAAAHQQIEKEINGQAKALLDEVMPKLEAYVDADATEVVLEPIKNYYLQNRYLIRLKENLAKLAV